MSRKNQLGSILATELKHTIVTHFVVNSVRILRKHNNYSEFTLQLNIIFQVFIVLFICFVWLCFTLFFIFGWYSWQLFKKLLESSSRQVTWILLASTYWLQILFKLWYICSLLVTTSADQTARIWKTMDFSEVQVLQHDAKRWVWDAAFSADSQYVFTGNNQ